MSVYTDVGLKLNFFEVEGRRAQLLTEIRYELGFKGSANWLVVPAGFVSDGISAPRASWSFLPPWGSKASKAAIIHDYLLATRPPGYERRQKIDDEFYIAMRAIGVGAVQAYAAWIGVRGFSIAMRPGE